MAFHRDTGRLGPDRRTCLADCSHRHAFLRNQSERGRALHVYTWSWRRQSVDAQRPTFLSASTTYSLSKAGASARLWETRERYAFLAVSSTRPEALTRPGRRVASRVRGHVPRSWMSLATRFDENK